MAHIEDFGQKIGGARKDMWKLNGITANDFDQMNDMERGTYVKKDNIWIKPDWEKLIADGTPQAIAYWQNKMRASLPPKPPKAGEEAQKNYISVVSQIRDAVMDVRDGYDIKSFFNDFLLPNFTSSPRSSWRVDITPEADGIVTNKVLKAAQANLRTMEREAKEKLFGVPKDDKAYVAVKQDLKVYCYDGDLVSFDDAPYNDGYTRMSMRTGLGYSYSYFGENSQWHDISKWEKGTYFVFGNKGPVARNFATREDAEQFIEGFARSAQITADLGKDSQTKDNAGRKQNFVPPQLAHVKYTGPNYRGIRQATSQMYLDDLRFRGGEFGNWLNTADRQTSLDMGYDALRNLADLLKVPPEDISLNGHLAIAFGARGKGGAGAGAAHYEPLRQVINLTKMSGAGCLAHEWGHALDHFIALSVGVQEFASETQSPTDKGIPDSFTALMAALKYKQAVVATDEQKKNIDPKIQNAKKNLRNWIQSVKPHKLSDDLNKVWDECASKIIEHPEAFSGSEYWTLGRRDRGPVLTNPYVEQLSEISKVTTNHVISRSDKQQIALWANILKGHLEDVEKLKPTQMLVETDYYKGSKEFDKIYSKMGHGYWQSSCEMFARAFDCYIADKVREQGYRSDYLSANSDSFHFRRGDEVIAAFPRGEEREVINKAFDNLFQDLKARGILHDAPIVEQVIASEPVHGPHRSSEERFQEAEQPAHYEQLSLDEMLFAASSKAGQQTSGRHGNLSDRSR